MTDWDVSGKTCLVTGGNDGIGKETVAALAARGATVLLVSRNKERGEAAVAELQARPACAPGTILLELCDLSSLAQIRALAARVLAEHEQLHVLLHNAGAFFSEYGETEDGFERQWAINHLAPFLLTELLRERLVASAPARVVVVASRAHRRGTFHWSDVSLRDGYTGMKAYGQSKLANIVFTYELARRLEGTGVTANALHPGVVSTSIAEKNSTGFVGKAWRLARFLMLSPAEGAATSVHLATGPDLSAVTGTYFVASKPRRSNGESRDTATWGRLWELSERQLQAGAG